MCFRWACDKKLREAVMGFAADSRRASPWPKRSPSATARWARPHQHATRILARAWLRVIWRCWQNRTPCKPALHGIPKHRRLPLVA